MAHADTTRDLSPRWTRRAFWIDLADRSVSTFAQAAVAALGGSALGLFQIQPLDVLDLALGATLLAVLKAFATPKQL